MISIYLAHSSAFSVLIPLFFLFIQKQNFKSPLLNAFSLLLFIAAFADLGSYLLSKTSRSSTIIIVNIFFIAQFFLLSYIYSLILTNKKIVYMGGVLFTFFLFVNTAFIQSINELQSWSHLTASIILTAHSMLFFNQKIRPEGNWSDELIEWINLAVLYYFAANLYLFSVSDTVVGNKDPEMTKLLWGIHNVNNIIKNVFFAIGIYYAGRKIVDTSLIQPAVFWDDEEDDDE